MKPERVLTIAEAAEATGLSRSALDSRVHRGTLPVERHGGRVFVRVEKLYELGLLHARPAATVTELLDRIERQAERIGRLEQELRRAGLELPA